MAVSSCREREQTRIVPRQFDFCGLCCGLTMMQLLQLRQNFLSHNIVQLRPRSKHINTAHMPGSSKPKKAVGMASEVDPDDQGPKMPESVPVEVFFDRMSNVERLEHLQEALYQAALIRRDYRHSGPKEKIGAQSNYKNLLAMIEAPHKDSSRGGGGSGKVGSILNAVKAGANFDDGTQVSGGGDVTPRELEPALRRSDEVAYESIRKKLPKGKRDRGKAVGHVVQSKLGSHLPRDVALRSVQAMTTIDRQSTVDHLKNKVVKDKTLRESMKSAAVAVRKRFVRSSSYPRAIYSVGTYYDYREKYDEQRLEMGRLRRVCDGLEPRDQEIKQAEMMQAMEKQIINQLALIKGLREKLKILREQGAAHQSQNSLTPLATPHMRSRSVTSPPPMIVTAPEASQDATDNHSMPSNTFDRLESAQFVSNGSFLAQAENSLSAAPANASFASASSSKQRLGGTLRMLSSPPTIHAPRGDNCVIAVLDLDAAKYLWETFPETLKTQTEILHRVVRTETARWRGYEALTRDDKHMVAFSNPFDACQFALNLQQSLLSADWSSVLAETPETSSEYIKGNSSNFLWRGLRVKVAVDLGVQAVTDPLFPNRVSYEGTAIETADYLHKLAIGGEVLISHSVAEAIHDQLDRMGHPILEDWGTVTYHPCRVGVRRITPKHLDGRRVAFNRALSTQERQLSEDAEDPDHHCHPPLGKVTLVTVLCPSMALVRAACSEQAARDTMQRAFHTLTSVARTEGGYVSNLNLESMSFLLAFEDPFGALKFAIDVQQAFLDQDWHSDILRIPQTSNVHLREKLIFSGLRAQIGIFRLTQVPIMYREPMESKMQYLAKDSKISSLIAAAAVDGEVLISDAILPLIMDRYDDLSCPKADYVTSIPTPASDTLLRLYQVFSENLNERASFVNRELRLPDENQELANSDVLTTFRNQVSSMQLKLQEKNAWINRLYLHLEQKTEAIGDIRKYVLGAPFFNINVPAMVSDLDSGFSFATEVVLVSFTFANVEELFDIEPNLMPDSIDVYDAFLDKMIKMFEGREVRRLPSRIARIAAFPDAQRAIACWCHILKTSHEEDWPPRLDDTTHAGLIMASEIFPGIQPDSTVWKGLRPVCAMHSSRSLVRFNTLTRTHEIIGDDVNTLAEMTRCASAGDCLVSSAFSTAYRDRLERSNTDLQFNEYGPFIRVLDTSQRFRLRAMKQSFTPQTVHDLPKPTQLTAFVVHVIMQDTYPDVESEFPDDVATFNETVTRVVAEFRGRLMGSLQSEFLAAFDDFTDGCRFAVHIHSELLRAKWSRDVIRVLDFREMTMNGQLVLRGIRAKVGCHCIHDITVILDLFSGRDQFYHNQLSIPMALALTAHSGETVATECARDALRKAFAAGSVDYFVEPCGTVKVDASGLRKETVYQLFPVAFKGRVAYFIDEDKRLNDPEEAAKRKKNARLFAKRHKHFAESMAKDVAFLNASERNTNPFDDPIHRKTLKLYQKIRPQLDEERSRFITCQETLALIETVSMMAEDQLLLGDPDEGAPYYAHMMLHELENGRTCKDIFYKKDMAAELLGNVLLSDAPTTVEFNAKEAQLTNASELEEANSGVMQPAITSPTIADRGGVLPRSPSSSQVAGGNDSGGRSSPPLSVPSAAKLLTVRGNESFSAMPPSGGFRKTVFSTNFQTVAIHPEDVVQLHIDVERFFQLLKLHGLDNPRGFALEYLDHAYAVAFPGRDPGELDDSVRWTKVTSLTSVIGMDVGSIDFQKLRCSMVAYLALAYEELTGVQL